MRGHNFLAIFGIIQAESGVINVNLNENLSVGSEVTRLRKVIDANVPFDADLEFRIVKQDRQNGLELFDIIGGDGVLKLKQVPDRETLCHRKMSCILRLQVIFKNVKNYSAIKFFEVASFKSHVKKFQKNFSSRPHNFSSC
jgi:hypothetical protein